MAAVYQRFRFLLCFAFLALLPLVALAALQAMQTSNNNVQRWLPPETPETKRYAWYREMFGEDELGFVSWEGCQLGDPRLDELQAILAPQKGKAADPKHRELFHEITTANQVVANLTAPPFELSQEEATERVTGLVLGPDKTAFAIFTLTAAGEGRREAAVEELKQVVTEQLGIPEEDLKLGGPAVVNATVDAESERAIFNWVVLSAILASAAAAWSLRSVMLTLFVFFVAGFSALAGLTLVYLSGGQMNLVLVVMPVLLGLLGMAAAVHLVNYYREAQTKVGLADAPTKAVQMALVPCFLSAFTTAIGLGSLYASEILPVREFGTYAAIGTLLSLGVLLLWLPATLQILPVKSKGSHESSMHGRYLGVFADRVIHWHTPALVLCLLAMVTLCIGTAFIKTTIRPMKFFPETSDLYQDYVWLEGRLGPLVPIEVVIEFENSVNSLEFLERLEFVHKIEKEIRQIEGISDTFSPVTYVPPEPVFGTDRQRYSWRELAVRKRLNKELLESREEFVEARYLAGQPPLDLKEATPEQRQAAGKEYYHISARVSALSKVPYYEHANRIAERVDPLLAQARKEGIAGVTAYYTGMDVVFFLAQQKLLEGLFTSFLTAFALIAIVMSVLLRGIVAGLLSMLPNVFPAIFIFGLMGWLTRFGLPDFEVDIGSMMTASAAMGIAVDGTLHFLTWFRRGVDRGLTRPEAVKTAYLHCGQAMYQTTLIAGLGIIVFWQSSFLPVSRFGLLMGLLLLAGLIGDLLLLPAMLVSPLGRCFVPKSAKSTGSETTDEQPAEVVETPSAPASTHNT